MSKDGAAGLTLVARGAPSEHPLLQVSWVRHKAEPYVNGVAHYVSKGKQSPNPPLHLFRGPEGRWQIAPEVGAGLAYAVANGPATHPNTVRAGEWLVPFAADGSNWQPAKDFVLKLDSSGTEKQPLLLEDLGEDFFVRIRATKLVWFVDPKTGLAAHSGAKAAGSLSKPGVRYCPVCAACFSANNFQSQHIPNVHKPPAPSAPLCTHDGRGGVLLSWQVGQVSAVTEPVSFAVECSVDGGEWESVNEDTLSPEARVCVPPSSLRGGHTYRFRVATHSLCMRGPFGDASATFLAGAAPAVPMLAHHGSSYEGTPSAEDLAEALSGSLAPDNKGDRPPSIPPRSGDRRVPKAPAGAFSNHNKANDQFTPPVSPPANSVHSEMGAVAAARKIKQTKSQKTATAKMAAVESGKQSRDKGSSGGGGTNKRRLEDATADDLLDLAGPDGLTWSLEEMWEIMTASSASGHNKSRSQSAQDHDEEVAKRLRQHEPESRFAGATTGSAAVASAAGIFTGSSSTSSSASPTSRASASTTAASGVDSCAIDLSGGSTFAPVHPTPFSSPPHPFEGDDDDIDDDPPPELFARALSREMRHARQAQEAGAHSDVYLDAMLQHFAAQPLAPNYRDLSDRSDADEILDGVSTCDSSSARSASTNGASARPDVPPSLPPRKARNGQSPESLAAPDASPADPAAVSETQRLIKLRVSLQGASLASCHRQITKQALLKLSQAGWTRELSLMLTHASAEAAEAAAADDATCRYLLRQIRAHRHARLPPARSGPATIHLIGPSATLSPPSANSLLLLLPMAIAIVAAFLALAASLGSVSTTLGLLQARAVAMPYWWLGAQWWAQRAAPAPRCRWAWPRGCVPDNAMTHRCRMRPLRALARDMCEANI